MAAIKMRKAKLKTECSGCKKTLNDEIVLYEILVGDKILFALCDGCMHELLTKLIKLGGKHGL